MKKKKKQIESNREIPKRNGTQWRMYVLMLPRVHLPE